MDVLELALDEIRRDLERRFSDDLDRLARDIPRAGTAAEAIDSEIRDLIQSSRLAMLAFANDAGTTADAPTSTLDRLPAI